MADFNPIPAEFGEDPTKLPNLPTNKPQPEPNSAAFLEELDKKSRRVEEKDEKNQTKQEKEATHEAIVQAPITEERIETDPQNLGSLFDMEKSVSSSEKTTTIDKKEGGVLKSDPTILTPSTPSGEDLPENLKGNSFEKGLAAPSSIAPKEKPVLKAPTTSFEPNLTSPEHELLTSKKSIQTETSSDTKDKHPGNSQTFEIPAATDAPKKTPQAQAPTTGAPSIEPSQPQKVTSAKENITDTPLIPLPKKQETIKQQPKEAPTPLNPADFEVAEKPKEIDTVKVDTSLSQTPEKPKIQQSLEKAMDNAPDLDVIAMETASAPLFSGPLPIESKRKEDTKPTKEVVEKELVQVQAPSSSEGVDQDKRDEKNKENDSELGSQKQMPDSLNPFPNISGEAIPPPQPLGFDRLPAHILDWFDRMVGIITVMQMQGKTETTVQLNSPKLPELSGVEIKITEYATAPLAYNIEFTGSPQAVNILQKQVEPLKNAFKTKNFNFSVNDITVSLQSNQEPKAGNDL